MTIAQSNLAAQDTTQILQRMFTGHVVGQPAMGYSPLEATVTTSDNTYVTVTINGFDTTATFKCYYEPRHHWSGSANVQATPPPAGTVCLIAFPPNDPEGYGWVLAFTAWPPQ